MNGNKRNDIQVRIGRLRAMLRTSHMHNLRFLRELSNFAEEQIGFFETMTRLIDNQASQTHSIGCRVPLLGLPHYNHQHVQCTFNMNNSTPPPEASTSQINPQVVEFAKKTKGKSKRKQNRGRRYNKLQEAAKSDIADKENLQLNVVAMNDKDISKLKKFIMKLKISSDDEKENKEEISVAQESDAKKKDINKK